MIDWWGPVIYEYYAGTEGNGLRATHQRGVAGAPGLGRQADRRCRCTSATTTATSCPRARPGTIYFEATPQFEYHNDPEKTAASRDTKGWTTLGDIGYLDDDGYLYLTDRKAHMIISGGVNIYPQEAENVLVTHPEGRRRRRVRRAQRRSRRGGQGRRAAASTARRREPAPALEQELIAFCRSSLAT